MVVDRHLPRLQPNRRQQQLRVWWEKKDRRLLPLLRACSDQGNFDRRVDQEIKETADNASWTNALFA